MTGKSRKPQVPTGSKTTRVRQVQDWQDGAGRWPGSILRGSRPEYDRLPKEQPPEPPFPGPAMPAIP